MEIKKKRREKSRERKTGERSEKRRERKTGE